MPRRPRRPLHLPDHSKSVASGVSMSTGIEPTRGIQQAIQARSDDHNTDEHNLSNSQDNGYQGYYAYHDHQGNQGLHGYHDYQGYHRDQGYHGYQTYPGYQGYYGYHGNHGFSMSFPEPNYLNSQYNVLPPNAGWGYGVGLAQALDTNDRPHRFVRIPGIHHETPAIGHPIIESSRGDSGRPDNRINERHNAVATLLAATNRRSSALHAHCGAKSGASSPPAEIKPKKHRINPDAPPFVPSIAAGNAQVYVQDNSTDDHTDPGHHHVQTAVARQPTNLDEYAKKLERWVGMEDDDEFVYFEEDPVPKNAGGTQSAR